MVFFIIFVFFFVWILIANIVQMMLIGTVRGQNLSELADKKYKIDTSLQPNRGKIYDRNGNILADNIESYKLVAVVSDKATEDKDNPRHVVDIDKTARELAKYVKLDESKIKEALQKQGVYQVEFGTAGKDISVEDKKKIEDLKLPGISFIATTKRYYPNGSIFLKNTCVAGVRMTEETYHKSGKLFMNYARTFATLALIGC